MGIIGVTIWVIGVINLLTPLIIWMFLVNWREMALRLAMKLCARNCRRHSLVQCICHRAVQL